MLIVNLLNVISIFSFINITLPFVASKKSKSLLYLYFSALISKLLSLEKIFPLYAFIRINYKLTSKIETSKKYLSEFKISKKKKNNKKNMIKLLFIYSYQTYCRKNCNKYHW